MPSERGLSLPESEVGERGRTRRDGATAHALAVMDAERPGELSVQDTINQAAKIQHAMKALMKENHHYGRIPGCGDKPTLLKPGAEKLSMMFRLAPTFDIRQTELREGHREYEVRTTLTHIPTGAVVGQGVGCCSTMEGKYRWRRGESSYEVTDERIPRDAKEKKAEYRKQGYGMKQIDGAWKWVRYTGGSGERVENADIADTYNTVLKMAKKRSLVDATLTATAASDIFAQDLEDLAEWVPDPEPVPVAVEVKSEAAAAPSTDTKAANVAFLKASDASTVEQLHQEFFGDKPKSALTAAEIQRLADAVRKHVPSEAGY